MRRTALGLGYLSALLLGLAALAHAAAGLADLVPEVRAGAGDAVAGAVAAGWLFGSSALLAFAGIVLASTLRVRAGRSEGGAEVLVVAVTLAGFGAAAFVGHDFNPHFLGFVVLGFLTGVYGGMARAVGSRDVADE